MQIEDGRNRLTIGRLDNPDVFAYVARGSIQNSLCLKKQLVLRRAETCLLEIPGQIKCLYQFCQQIVIALSGPKGRQSEMPVTAWPYPGAFYVADRILVVFCDSVAWVRQSGCSGRSWASLSN